MQKLRLDLDTLAVQSFATSGAGAERGTVHGAMYPTDLCTVGCDGTRANCPSPQCTTQTE